LGTILKLTAVLEADLGEFMTAVLAEVKKTRSSSSTLHPQKTTRGL